MSYKNKSLKLSLIASMFLSSLSLIANDKKIEKVTSLGQITVTGERDKKTLINTQSSISILDELELEKKASKNIFESLVGTPNFTLLEGDSLPAIRGVQPMGNGKSLGNVYLTGVAPRIVQIVDGFAINPTWTNNSYNTLFGVEQIEVLRGPQSTLRGSNAMSGAIVVTTKKPTFDFKQEYVADIFSDNTLGLGYNLGALVSGTLINDELAGSLSIDKSTKSDIIEDFVKGGYKGSDPDKAQTIKSLKASAKLLYLPKNIPELEANLKLSHSTGRTQLYRNQILGPTASTSANFKDRLNAGTDVRVVKYDSNFVGTSLNYDLKDSNSIEFLASYSKDKSESDTSLTSSAVIFNDIDDEATSLEALYRFGENEELNGFLGILYKTKDSYMDANAYVINKLLVDNKMKESSIFTDLNYPLSNNLDIHFGGRVLKYEQDRNSFFFVPLVNNEKVKETVVLPKLGFTYKLNDDQNLGLSIRRGFNAGGTSFVFDGPFPNSFVYSFKPEYVTTYESSYKALLNDGNISFLATAFYNDYKDQQLSVKRTSASNPRIINQPKTISYGLELEAIMQVNNNLSLNVGVGLLETELKKTNGYNAKVGNRVGYDPDFTFNAGLDWQFTKEFSFDSKYTYVGEYYTDIENTNKAGNYSLLDLGLSYKTKNKSIRLYAQNITDEMAFIYKSNTFASVGSPRTIGLTVKFEF